MTFGNIYWLYAFIPVFILLLLGYRYSQKKRHHFFDALLAPKLKKNLMATYSPGRRLFKSLLWILAVFLLFIALAQPRWGHSWQEQKSKGIDILFALDVSKSMLAEDIKPNRLERSKFAILDLTQKLEGDRFGLIAFAGNAFLQCPLTLDYNAFRESLEQTDPSVIYYGGTNIGAAIRTAEPVFSKEDNFKILILITDGEDLEESGIAAATSAAKNDIKIYTVGVGTTQGELIPIKDKNDSPDYLRDADGNVVKTKLDENTLRKIAEVTDGFYVPLGPKGEGLNEIYQRALKNIPKQNLSSNLRQIPLERFQWPLGIAILLLIIEMLLSTRKRVRSSSRASMASLAILGLFFLTLPNNRLDASVTDAYKAYHEGQFEKASGLYQKAQKKDPENPQINYNLGSSFYKNGDYSSALKALNNAIKTQDLQLQQKVFYNMGNNYFRSGEQALQTNPKKTTEFWESAVKSFQNATELDPQDRNSQENLEFVKKKLEELKQQQQNQQQQNQEDQKQQDQQDQQKQDKQDQQDQQNQKDQNDQQNQDQENQKDSENKDQNQDRDQNKPDDSSTNKGKDKQDSKQSPADQNENPEAPPKDQSNNSSPQKGDKPQDKKDPQSKPSEGNEQTDEEAQPSKQQKHRQMNQEEAGEILKALQNSEKKLPAVSAKGDKPDRHTDNFKDW